MADGARRPSVVIIGAGFGGLYAARVFRHRPVDVTVVDRTNHHLFQPLLYQVATATLAPTDITAPVRWLLRKQDNTRVVLAEVNSIDAGARTVVCDAGALTLSYDYLIVATGSRHSYFGHSEWEKTAPGLKSIDDAIVMRQRFLLAFERAEKAATDDERRALLTFVVVGGGPTGVELAGMLPFQAWKTLPTEFRNVNTRGTRVVLCEGGPRVLPTFPESLSVHAQRELEELGVEVRTNTVVTNIEHGAVHVGGPRGERIATENIFWAAGNEASPLGKQLGAPVDRVGRVQVEADLSVPGHGEVFVVGDLAAMKLGDGLVPGVAPAAMQSGRHAAKNILRLLEGRATRPFRYFNKGDLATIGRNRAVAHFSWLDVWGRPAWWFWLFVHIMYLAGFRNRASVLVEWGYSYFTYERGARLIVMRREPSAGS
ncbi:MAG TPA: NAD(P)/FAD-dependent oxidoreductase [Gemmatimonadaceae bacterium]|nr:NAD(P)/FAD-dependent oxidoreductase [Gemmatimonadaceae bacterium]